jgi:hypothetical protein
MLLLNLKNCANFIFTIYSHTLVSDQMTTELACHYHCQGTHMEDSRTFHCPQQLELDSPESIESTRKCDMDAQSKLGGRSKKQRQPTSRRPHSKHFLLGTRIPYKQASLRFHNETNTAPNAEKARTHARWESQSGEPPDLIHGGS